jgi:hypothetical protein
MTPPAPGQDLSLPAREQEETGGISITAIGQSAQHRQSQGNNPSQAFQILGPDIALTDSKDHSMNEDRPECELLRPIRFRS